MDPRQLFDAVKTDVVNGIGEHEDGDDDGRAPEAGGFDRRELEVNFEVLNLVEVQAEEDSVDARIDRNVVVTDEFGVVPWETKAHHDRVFEGIAPSGGEVTIRGCTYVLEQDPANVFVRFVDWAAVLAQMGVTFNTKPLVVDGGGSSAES